MNRPTLSLALSGRTLDWLRLGGRPARADWRSRLRLSWETFWFERNLALSRRLPSSQETLRDPVFILGPWRSGTTFLHELVGAVPSLTYPTTWQCMHPSVFRLQKNPTARPSTKRPMDGLMVDALSPQEDEFALLALGVPSVYRGFLDPRRLLESSRWLNPDSWSRSEPSGWFETWTAFLAGVSTANGRPERRLVLKSPNHTFRIRALLDAFPNASYTWLVRDPVDLWHSNRKMWTAMFQAYALWDWDESVLNEFLGVAFEYVRQCLAIAAEHLPIHRLVVIDFDGLTQHPVEYVRAANDRLQLATWSDMERLVAMKANQFAEQRKDVYKQTNIPASVQRRMDALQIIQSRAFGTHGLHA
jgi:hypothetical protein